jgi:hypothetical protein
VDHLLSVLGNIPLDDFARAGGGGSSSGGSGSGSGDSIFFVIGYLPMHALGALLAKLSRKSTAAKVVANVAGWIIAIVYAWFWTSIMGGLGFAIGIAALIGIAAGLYGWFGKIKQSSLIKGRLQSAAAQDSAWDEARLTEYAKQTFLRYQQDWSRLDVEAMKAYLTPNYQYHAALLVYVLQTMGRQDIMEDVTITEALVTNATDEADNSQDKFTIGIQAHARDKLLETKSGEVLFTDNSSFSEFWHFVRSDKTWLLDGITQSTENAMAINADLVNLAHTHNYRYSEDMGWLFIPKRGQLFGGAKFGKSDINNHIVGMYDGRLLVQVYSYVKDPDANARPYVIAQVNVPREYGNIVVRRKKMLQMGIRGLERVETEWTRFNDKYEVFASGYEQATSFELLNPTYMEQLEALPFEVSIEVVDNVVYLYTDEREGNVATYKTMLNLLDKAFKEMRL